MNEDTMFIVQRLPLDRNPRSINQQAQSSILKVNKNLSTTDLNAFLIAVKTDVPPRISWLKLCKVNVKGGSVLS
jgi:hypothetical protein